MDLSVALEGLDLSAECGELEQIQGDLSVLGQHYTNIAATGGICRDTAQQLVRDCAVQMDEKLYPVNSFTEAPSKTNLVVAQESIINTIGTKVWDMIRKAAALLVKIAKYVIEAIRKAIGRSKDTAKANSAVHALADANRTIRTSGLTSLMVKPSARGALDRANLEIASAEESWNSNFNALVFDLITDSKFGDAVRLIALDLLGNVNTLDAKIDLFHELLDEPPVAGDQVSMISVAGRLRAIAQPLEANRMYEFFKAAGYDVTRTFPGNVTIIDLCTSVRETQRTLRFSPTAQKVGPEEGTDYLVQKDQSTFAAPFLANHTQWLDAIQKLQHRAQELSQIHPRGVMTQELSQAYVTAFDVLDREIKALQVFLTAAEACHTVRDQVLHDALGYQLSVKRRNDVIIHNSDDTKLKQQYNDTMRDAQRKAASF